MMHTEGNITANHSGFTLVELMVAMVVAFLVSAAVYASYKIQQKTHTAQLQVVEIQQNLRIAMETLTSDLLLAGLDPKFTGEYKILPGEAGPANFTFYADLCEDGDPASGQANCLDNSGPFENQIMPERFTYRLFTPASADADDTTSLLRRIPDPNPAPVPPLSDQDKIIAENIEVLEFYYIMANGTATTAPSPGQIDNIRAVRITLVARADEPDYNYTNTSAYPLGSGATFNPPDDNFRRRSLFKTIELRNI